MGNEESKANPEEVLTDFSEMEQKVADFDQAALDTLTEDAVEAAEEMAEGETEEEVKEMTLEEALELIEALNQRVKDAEEGKKAKKTKPKLTSDQQAIVDSHYTAAELGVELKMDARLVRKMIRGGKIDAVKVQSRWYINDAAVEKFKESQKEVEEETAEEAETEVDEAAQADQAAMDAHEELVEAVKVIDLN